MGTSVIRLHFAQSTSVSSPRRHKAKPSLNSQIVYVLAKYLWFIIVIIAMYRTSPVCKAIYVHVLF